MLGPYLQGLPHARGGVSHDLQPVQPLAESSPRPWGCFSPRAAGDSRQAVFPTPVGVFLFFTGNKLSKQGLPHARGGVSAIRDGDGTGDASSPRPWGCFSSAKLILLIVLVFPTPVGVFLTNATARWPSPGLPHARGGVSSAAIKAASEKLSSPRPWGCFYRTVSAVRPATVFPTPVGVFPVMIDIDSMIKGLPHARGGVSFSAR